MKKPKKKQATFINHKEGKVQLLRYESGYNTACDDWEKWLKSKGITL